MRGSLDAEVEGLYHVFAKGIGVKRHGIKLAGQKDTVIHSDTTRVAYVRVWHRVVRFAADTHGITRVDQLTADDVNAWLALQVRKGLAPLTVAQYCAALKKLEHALNALRERKGGRWHV